MMRTIKFNKVAGSYRVNGVKFLNCSILSGDATHTKMGGCPTSAFDNYLRKSLVDLLIKLVIFNKTKACNHCGE